MSRMALVLALTVLVIAPAAVLAGGTSVRSGDECTAGWAGWPGSCTDPVGDVKNGPGPDITEVTEQFWEIFIFKVTFAKAPALAHNAAYTDKVSISIAAMHAMTTTHYVLTISAKDNRQVLRRLPDGKPQVLREWFRLSGKTVSLVVNGHLLGAPGTIRYRVKASRERLDGTPASSDYVPNTGAMEWSG